MRKLLLASAAIVGAGAAIGGSAYAQPATPPAPPAPVVTTPQMQTLTTANSGNSANSNNNYQAAMLPGTVANPTPGTMVVRFNGAVWSEFFLGGGDGFVGRGPTVASTGGLGPFTPGGPAFITTGPGTNAGQKLNNYAMGTYFRLYPGVDAMASNGLRYGAQVELRENFSAAQANTGATGGSGLTSGQTMYVRRAFVYVAGENWGLIRFGQTDGVTGIFDNGITTGQQPGQPCGTATRRAWFPATGRPIRGSRSRAPNTATSASCICRRRSRASTSACSMRRATATRSSVEPPRSGPTTWPRRSPPPVVHGS
jgi:hypothetical protein